jgi:DNA-binding transcriptional regulator GbsR (MarR family)
MRNKIKEKIYSTFANTATSLGYSEIHGRIIACLLINEGPVSLSVVAKETGYSPSMISLSVDFLETVGMVKRVKKPGDRKLYLESSGSLLDGLRKALIVRVDKNISGSLQEFEEYKKEINSSKDQTSKSLLNAIDRLETEIKKMEKYIKVLSKIKLS